MSLTVPQPKPRGFSFALDVLRTPVGELLRGRIGSMTAAERAIAAADLPLPLADLVRLVVSRTGLWRGEQTEVTRELVAHFEDGLATGATADELAASFGDPVRAAKLIRRAKRRHRPLVWKAMKLTEHALGAVVLFALVVYAVQAVRIYAHKPILARNYMAEWNAAALAVPETERAWPIYRAAALATGEWPGDRDDRDRRPGDESWPARAAFVAENARAVELLRRAAATPKLGWVLTTHVRDEDAALLNRGQATPAATAPAQADTENPAFISVLLPPLRVLRDGARLLTIDAYAAAEVNDARRADEDLGAILRMFVHARETRFLVGDLVALALLGQACHLLDTLLADYPDLLDDARLTELAHRLSAVGGDDLCVRFDSEWAAFADILQRYYTDDGHGDGLPRPELFRVASVSDMDRRGLSGLGGAPGALLTPALSPLMAGRRELLTKYRAFLDRYEAERRMPLWERDERGVDSEIELLMRSPLQRLRYWPLAVLMPALDRVNLQEEFAKQQRDATLVAVALELYRRRHGAWPVTLDELTPHLLPKVPPDRYDGQPLKYRLVDRQPLLYSVGVDRNDDGGRLPDRPGRTPYERNRAARRWEPAPAASTGAPREAPPDGDWRLWPPVE